MHNALKDQVAHICNYNLTSLSEDKWRLLFKLQYPSPSSRLQNV